MKIIPLVGCAITLLAASAGAAGGHNYMPDEYVTIVDGRSPDGLYAIGAHGEGQSGFNNFHIYLMDAKTGKKMGPLEEAKDPLDTDPEMLFADWSKDSHQVSITYRIDHKIAVVVRYRVENGRAYYVSGPTQIEMSKYNRLRKVPGA